MESQVNPNNIQDRADKLAAAEKPVETPAPAAPVTPPAETPKPDASSIPADPSKKPEIKPVEPVEPAKQPNDPTELRKWATKASQENAALRDEMKALKAAIEKMTKKPIDYKELAKNPEAIQKQIEIERQEAIEEMQAQLEEKALLATKNETMVERMKREQDATNFPEWKRVFHLIQNLAANTDGRINFNKAPGDVLDDLYALALQLSPAPVVAPKEEPKVEEKPVIPAVKTYSEAEVEAIRKEAFAKAQEALKNEANGAGLGSAGKGGRRSSGVSKEALHEMPLADLKRMIQE
jgi:predicted RNase H-like nuclease (RuvC/YqgF family)